MPITRLTPRHAGVYRALMLEAYERHPEAFASSAAERAALPLVWWKNRLLEGDAAGQVVFGAFAETELAGVAGLRFESREKEHHKATLFGMYVRERFRGEGLGRQLVEAVLDHARGRPETLLVQLTVIETNTHARRLYEACGFTAFGTEPLAVHVGAEYLAKVHMWCEL